MFSTDTESTNAVSGVVATDSVRTVWYRKVCNAGCNCSKQQWKDGVSDVWMIYHSVHSYAYTQVGVHHCYCLFNCMQLSPTNSEIIGVAWGGVVAKGTKTGSGCCGTPNGPEYRLTLTGVDCIFILHFCSYEMTLILYHSWSINCDWCHRYQNNLFFMYREDQNGEQC